MNPFALDLRAIALVRIAIALLLLADLAIRFPDIDAFYVASGVCPVESMPNSHWTMKHLELYRQAESWGGVALLFFLAATAATSLALGFYSRTSAALSWYLLVSLQNREIYLNDGGDILLRVILLSSIFLPLGARWSVDALKHPHWRKLPNNYVSWATGAYLIQTCVVYLVAAALKSHASWRVTGDALYMALSLDQHSTALAQWLLSYPGLLRVLNFMALTLEFCCPLLILCPLFQPWLRLLGVCGLVIFHVAIASCLHLGLFVPICLAVLLGLVPTIVFDRGRTAAEPGEEALQLPLPSGYKSGLASKAFLVSYIGFVVFQNAVTIPEIGMVREGQSVLRGSARELVLGYGRATGLMQNWTLFAPHPILEDGWFVVEGRRSDGSTVDLVTGQSPANFSKPPLVSATFPNQRWRRHFQNLCMRYNPVHVPLYLRWAGQRWNRLHADAEKVTSIRLVYMRELTELPGIPLQATPVELGVYPSSWLEGSLL